MIYTTNSIESLNYQLRKITQEPRPEPSTNSPSATPNQLNPTIYTNNLTSSNKAETRALISSIQSFMAAYQLPEVIVVADAGMMSDANLKALAGAGLKYIIGHRIPEVPHVVEQWQHKHPNREPADQLVLAQQWSRGPAAG